MTYLLRRQLTKHKQFLLLVRHFLVYLSKLFWSEFVRAAIFIMLPPFCFAALNLLIYLPAIYLRICLYKIICPSFPKAVLSAKEVLVIKTVYCEIQIQKKALYELIGLRRYVLWSKIVELYSQSLLLSLCFKWPLYSCLYSTITPKTLFKRNEIKDRIDN